MCTFLRYSNTEVSAHPFVRCWDHRGPHSRGKVMISWGHVWYLATLCERNPWSSMTQCNAVCLASYGFNFVLFTQSYDLVYSWHLFAGLLLAEALARVVNWWPSLTPRNIMLCSIQLPFHPTTEPIHIVYLEKSLGGNLIICPAVTSFDEWTALGGLDIVKSYRIILEGIVNTH